MSKLSANHITQWLTTPVDAHGLSFFRLVFGLLMAMATARFMWMGWVDTILVEPTYHFTYTGFEWIKPLSRGPMYGVFIGLLLSALGIMIGWKTRAMAAIFFVLFTWVELIEKAAYLNHYYLVSLIGFLLILLPSNRALSVDAKQQKLSPVIPRWAHLWLAGQVAIVYFFAGLAKFGSDWLLYGEPLYTWLQHHTDWPILGPLFVHRWWAILMSISGAIFDTTIVFFLCWKKTRKLAYISAVAFHLMVWSLFPIGMFSPVMLLCGTLFFDPSWPRQLLALAHQHAPLKRLINKDNLSTQKQQPPHFARSPLMYLMVIWLGVQAILPLRHFAYPGDTNWTERGFRFAWRVMLIEKTGQVEYRVVLPAQSADQPPLTLKIYPRKDLTRLQYRMLCTQPDMMLAYAHKLEHDLRQKYPHTEGKKIKIYADSYVAFNGRHSQRYIDPDQDLLVLEPWFTWKNHPDWILEKEPR